MRRFYWELDRLGGVASTSELRALGYGRDDIEVARMHGKIIRVRKALWALPDVSPDIVRAMRLGGRLACVSALAFHGADVTPSRVLHIEVLPNTSGSKAAAARRAGAVLHWSRHPLGHRMAVDTHTAWQQYDSCDAVRAAGR